MKDLNRTASSSGLRIAPPLHKKQETPGRSARVSRVGAALALNVSRRDYLVEERPFRRKQTVNPCHVERSPRDPELGEGPRRTQSKHPCISSFAPESLTHINPFPSCPFQSDPCQSVHQRDQWYGLPRRGSRP